MGGKSTSGGEPTALTYKQAEILNARRKDYNNIVMPEIKKRLDISSQNVKKLDNYQNLNKMLQHNLASSNDDAENNTKKYGTSQEETEFTKQNNKDNSHKELARNYYQMMDKQTANKYNTVAMGVSKSPQGTSSMGTYTQTTQGTGGLGTAMGVGLAIVGGVVGGPAGAALGWGIGSGVGSTAGQYF